MSYTPRPEASKLRADRTVSSPKISLPATSPRPIYSVLHWCGMSFTKREGEKSSFLFYMLFHFISLHYQRTLNAMDKPINRIKEVLEEKGIKQIWLAEKLGKSFSIVNSYVCNRRQPSLETLFQIAEILGVDVKRVDLINPIITV